MIVKVTAECAERSTFATINRSDMMLHDMAQVKQMKNRLNHISSERNKFNPDYMTDIWILLHHSLFLYYFFFSGCSSLEVSVWLWKVSKIANRHMCEHCSECIMILMCVSMSLRWLAKRIDQESTFDG